MSVLAEIRAGIQREGWSKVARQSGLQRVTLHRAFGENGRGRPTLGTIEKVLPHVGLRLVVEEAR